MGDVHGCADELEDLLERVGWRPGRDVVVLVGDLVNKGPKSVEVRRRGRFSMWRPRFILPKPWFHPANVQVSSYQHPGFILPALQLIG